MPEHVTHETHSVASSPFSPGEQEETEDWYSATAEWEESAVVLLLPIDGQEDAETDVDVPWSNGRAPSSIHESTRNNGYNSYSAIYDRERPSDVVHLSAGSDEASSASLCDPAETASQIEDVMVPQTQSNVSRALQDKHDGNENVTGNEPSIGDVLYIIKLWLASTTRRVTHVMKRWLALVWVMDWIRQAYSKMRGMLATTTRANHQREDEDVD
ncbi:hypothetical protein F4860DRAFT_515316 [Xylaria cubensis]|nr:hypothetical protein F4860DRAFT_515316 [Xylaria cubensis]